MAEEIITSTNAETATDHEYHICRLPEGLRRLLKMW